MVYMTGSLLGDVVIGLACGIGICGGLFGLIYFAINADDPNWDVIADIRHGWQWCRQKVKTWQK